MKVFDEILVGLQSEEPQIHRLRRCLLGLLRNLFVRFLKPAALVRHGLPDVEYTVAYNQKDDSELLIGEDAREMIKKKEEHLLREKILFEFYANVRQYLIVICTHLKNKLHLNDPVLIGAEVADVTCQLTSKSKDLLFI